MRGRTIRNAIGVEISETIELDDSTKESLKALGYLE